jgi:hypothetical protein
VLAPAVEIGRAGGGGMVVVEWIIHSFASQ